MERDRSLSVRSETMERLLFTAFAVAVALQLFVLSSSSTVSAFDPPAVFPVSTRKALQEKAQQINPKDQYSTAGWSNRAATVLTPQYLNPGVYTADRPFMWNTIDVGCRSTIIELPSSSTSSLPDLWIHSPVTLDGPMQKALQSVGKVKYVVSPNYEHVKFAPQWFQAYPDSELWACPGLPERLPEVYWKGEVPYGYRPKDWQGQKKTSRTLGWDTDVIDALHIDVEINPFTGKPFFNEVIYYHKPSKTLMTTDLFWNYPADTVPNSEFGRDDSWELAPVVDRVPFRSRLWKVGMDKIFTPFYNNFMVQDKDAYKEIANHIINVWDVEMVIPAHGDILRGKEFIKVVLKKHFEL